MNWALQQETGSPSAKVVLLVLANRAHPDGRCWPGFGDICRQTELSRRAVIDNIRRLEGNGLLHVTHRPRPQTNLYRLNVGSAGAALVQETHDAEAALGSAGTAPSVVQELHPDSAGAAPKPKGTQSKTTRTVRARATHLPDDFELTDERRAVAEAEKVPAERTFAKFCDYWRAASGQNARKRDWDATWRNWCRKESEMRPGGKPQTTRKSRYEQAMEANDALYPDT